MNNTRRKSISKIVENIACLRDELEALKDEEQECFDNMPYGIQCSERGEISEGAVSSLEYAIDSIDTAIDSMNEVI